MTKLTTIKIKVGELGAQFLQRNNLPAKGHVDKQPAGLSFYEYDWSSKAPGLVVVEHDLYTFQIAHALGVMGTQDNDRIDSGLESFSVRAGITAADTIMHDEARNQFYCMLQDLLRLGWKPLIPYDYPRLAGEQAHRYYEENNYYSIPPDYAATIEQWMKMQSCCWRLYIDNVFLEIDLYRDSKQMNLNLPGAYLLVFNLASRAEEARSHFDSDNRDQWQELWVDKIKSLKKERYEKEKELIKRGYTIFTDYDEPKIHPADPVEP